MLGAKTGNLDMNKKSKLNTKADFKRAGIRVHQNAASWREDGNLFSAFFWKEKNGRWQADRFQVVSPMRLVDEIKIAKDLSLRTTGRIMTSGHGMTNLETVAIQNGKIISK